LPNKKPEEGKSNWVSLESRQPLGPPIDLTYSRKSYTEKKTLEFDPERIKPGEAIVVKVSKWDGLVNAFFAVMNVGGKQIVIKKLEM
jgi:hypothetical protein